MNETYVTVVGNAATEVTFRVTATGTPMATFRLATAPRRFDRERSSWQDGQTSFYSVTCWRSLAENVVASIKKGHPVVVTGRQRVRLWSGDDGRNGMSVELDAVAVGHDLTRCTTTFEKARRGQGGDDAQAQASAQALAELSEQPLEEVDPWTGEMRTPAVPAGRVADGLDELADDALDDLVEPAPDEAAVEPVG